jgi:hypothetical protein
MYMQCALIQGDLIYCELRSVFSGRHLSGTVTVLVIFSTLGTFTEILVLYETQHRYLIDHSRHFFQVNVWRDRPTAEECTWALE